MTVARIEGEFDKLAADAVRSRLFGLTQDGPLIVDLDGVVFIDSAGLHILFGLARAARRGFAIVVADDNPIRRVVELAHLTGAMPVCGSLEDAARDVA